ncbi:ESX secretion-associated protein EspG [Nocardia sp. NPDC050378]|uniref:ESX secretion-associated protein EspG n=1 Tax=Nocardia sp. NPDC050378 TaxID=3155400 RepID=UPI003410E8D2
MNEWTFDPDDFAIHWYSDAVDRFPRPLRYTSRFAYQEAFDDHRAKLLASYSRDELLLIRSAMDTAAEATFRIQISGSTTKTRDHTTAAYRVHATRNDFQAVVISQINRDNIDGPITVRLVRPENLPRELINCLPKASPGGQPATTFHTSDMAPRRDTYLEDVAHNSPQDRARRFFDRPLDGRGRAALYLGAVLDRPKPHHAAEWHDFTDDGRYTITRNHNDLIVDPATPQGQAGQFARWIDTAVQLNQPELDEIYDDPW